MADRSQLYEKAQIGIESTEGASVPSTKILTALGIDLSVGLTVQEAMAMGYNLPLLEDPVKQWTIIRAGGNLTYTEALYILNSLLKTVTPTAGGATSQVWTYNPRSNADETRSTFTIEQGQTARAAKATGCRFDGVTISLDRNTGCKISATGIGMLYQDGITMTALAAASQIDTVGLGAASAGTVTLTISSPNNVAVTTGSIAYNASTATVQSAINSAIGAGNCVVSGAGPWPAALTFTFAGTYANQPVTVTGTPTGLTGGSITVTPTTPGLATEVPLVPVLGSQLNFFLDSTPSFGTTKLLRATKIDLAIAARSIPYFAANTANAAYSTALPTAGTVRGAITMMADAAGMGPLVNMGVGSTFYLRAQATGALIEASHNYQFTEDLCVKVQAAPTFSMDQGARMVTYPFSVVHDQGYGRGLTLTFENLITAL